MVARDSQPTGLVRPARTSDLTAVVAMAAALWPDEAVAAHTKHMRAVLAGKPASTLPLVLFVAEVQHRLVGFVEVGLRSHADGCDGRRPVGFVEGWFVLPPHRGRGIGRALVGAAERWSAAQGCREMASDTWVDSTGSRRAHQALGFEVVDRCVNFRKDISAAARQERARRRHAGARVTADPA